MKIKLKDDIKNPYFLAGVATGIVIFTVVKKKLNKKTV